jgi:DHA1 family tetracycline resistance protein-like MFS transporter
MQNKRSFLLAAMPLLLVLFIDGMGLGLVIPVLNGLIFDTHSTFLAAATVSPIMHNVIYGAVIGVYMLCWFWGAAILGDMSDYIGRKKSLVICLVGAFLGYLLSAVAVSLHSLSFLIIGRVIAGITSGSQPIAQAAIIDLSQPENKARNIGFILLALSFGFIFGPLLGGILSDNRLVARLDFSTPFYFSAIISSLNIVLLLLFFHETFESKQTQLKINPYQAIHIFIAAFKNKKVKNLSIIFFIFIFGWSSFYSFICFFLL